MSELVLTGLRGAVGVITIGNPPVNALSPGVPEGIDAAIRTLEADGGVKAIVLIGGGKTFIAGADIREFGKLTASGDHARGPGLNPVLNRIEMCAKPVVAAIHGTAFGGGLETAMACHYRVALETALVGQPEVKLGLIPGAGGTQRLPRLAGVAKAVEMCVQGDPISAREARESGIVDEIVEGDLLEGAIAFAMTKIARTPRRTRDWNDKLHDHEANAIVFEAARESARKKQRNRIAPLAAIEAIEAATKLPFEAGLAQEAELFQKCLFSDQSKALIHVFFGEREVAKIFDIPKDEPLIPVKQVAVIGAGTMGSGIAMTFANAGFPVLLKEIDQIALDRGMAVIRGNYANSVKKGRLTQAAAEERMARVEPVLDYARFGDADLIVEAAFEGMDLKKSVFAELDRVAKSGAILSTNTSTLDINEIASATSRPEMVVGTHFFSPANVMRLLEVVRGSASAKPVLATAMALAKKLGKIGVLVGNCRGFVGNRMFGPYRREAQFLVEEGASTEAVDQALYGFGMAMGPLATGDLAGLDVGWRIRQEFHDADDTSVRQPLIEDRLCELGRYGQKTQAGWYLYDEQRRPMHDPKVDRIIDEARREAGLTPREISSEEIVERTIYALVNEGARLLEEGIALRAVDIDIIYLNGYGFPAYRGGPMFYADSVGLRNVYEHVREFERLHGKLWTPAPLLKKLAEDGGTFTAFRQASAA